MHSSSSEYDALTGLPCTPTRQSSRRRTTAPGYQYRAIARSRRRLEPAIPGSRPRPKLHQSFGVNFLSLSTSPPQHEPGPELDLAARHPTLQGNFTRSGCLKLPSLTCRRERDFCYRRQACIKRTLGRQSGIFCAPTLIPATLPHRRWRAQTSYCRGALLTSAMLL